jgi:hypothetical protein
MVLCKNNVYAFLGLGAGSRDLPKTSLHEKCEIVVPLQILRTY